MNREEILEKSKRENHGQDIADLETSKASMQTGFILIICLLAAVSVVDALVFERTNYECFFAVMAGTSAIFACKYIKLRKKHELILAVVYALIAAAFMVAWILQLLKGRGSI